MSLGTAAQKEKIREIGRANPEGRKTTSFYLRQLDFSVLQQCIHCGMCLPTCPTYDTTRFERNSPRGRIALMRAVAEGDLEITSAFGEELYFCLGCLACETVCPAGVDYARMFEHGRADIERAGVLANPRRDLIREILLRRIFASPDLLRGLGRLLRLYQASGLQTLVRKVGLTALLPKSLRELEPLTPDIPPDFSDRLIRTIEPASPARYRVGLLTGCVQDLVYPHINRDTADVLLANGCTVITPRRQSCCGSLHAHNGEIELAREMARRNIDAFDLDQIDAIITNAGGCGAHLKSYGHLLGDEPAYAARAREWDTKLRDIHEWLCEIGLRPPTGGRPRTVTYHESCHLCHGQRVSRQPREILRAIPGVRLVELPEAAWCCGSAGIYNITQPEMSARLLRRKMEMIGKTGATVVATANPGCLIQLTAGAESENTALVIRHPVSLLAEAYREGTAQTG